MHNCCTHANWNNNLKIKLRIKSKQDNQNSRIFKNWSSKFRDGNTDAHLSLLFTYLLFQDMRIGIQPYE